jgi:hypothetical protein
MMKRLVFVCLVGIVLLAANSAIASAGSGKPATIDGICGMGGPDDYGYYWIDSDSASGPDYVWIDITSKPGAIQVQGLGDDNVVGPFPIGFDFNYYWYIVDSFYIGSNGHLSFSEDTVFGYPFSDLPQHSRPNNMICPLAGDLDFSRGEPECWYWSDGAETLVVSWIEVPEFYTDPGITDSTHTFQVIMTRSDSSFYYMYAEQHGHFEGRDSNYVIGIEDISGTVGLQYCRSGRPRYNEFHDSLAIAWWAEPDFGPLWPEIGIVYAMNETFQSHMTFQDSAVTLVAELANLGNTVEHDVVVTATVTDSSQHILFADTIIVDEISPCHSSWLVFSPDFLPPGVGEYKLTFKHNVFDMNASNNRIMMELRVVEYAGPGAEAQLLYDDGQLESRVYWQGDSSGLANEFEVPFAPFKVEGVRIPLEVSAASRDLYVWLMDADSTGYPARVLAADTLTVFSDPHLQWALVHFSDHNIVIDREKTFAVVFAPQYDSILLGADYVHLRAISRRGWECIDGEFAHHRKREVYDLGIHMIVSWQDLSGDRPHPLDAVLPSMVSLWNYPNPFNSVTKISYDLPTSGHLSLKVYDISGRLVETLVDGRQAAGTHTLHWDASGIASGIYFYRLTTADGYYARKMLLLR